MSSKKNRRRIKKRSSIIEVVRKYDLREDFDEVLNSFQDCSSSAYDEASFWENYYDGLWSGVYNDTSSTTKNKSKSSLDELSNEEKDDLVNMYYDTKIERSIYFYEDVNKVKCREFNDLTTFDLFLTQENIEVNDNDIYDMVYAKEIHCCINPVQLNKYGYKEMVICYSHNELRWEISDLCLGTCLAKDYCLED